MPYISSSGQVYTIDGPRQRRVQLEKPILLAVAMLLCVFVLARQAFRRARPGQRLGEQEDIGRSGT